MRLDQPGGIIFGSVPTPAHNAGMKTDGQGVGAATIAATAMLLGSAACFVSYQAGVKEGRHRESQETSTAMMTARTLESQNEAYRRAEFEREWEESGEPVSAKVGE